MGFFPIKTDGGFYCPPRNLKGGFLEGYFTGSELTLLNNSTKLSVGSGSVTFAINELSRLGGLLNEGAFSANQGFDSIESGPAYDWWTTKNTGAWHCYTKVISAGGGSGNIICGATASWIYTCQLTVASSSSLEFQLDEETALSITVPNLFGKHRLISAGWDADNNYRWLAVDGNIVESTAAISMPGTRQGVNFLGHSASSWSSAEQHMTYNMFCERFQVEDHFKLYQDPLGAQSKKSYFFFDHSARDDSPHFLGKGDASPTSSTTITITPHTNTNGTLLIASLAHSGATTVSTPPSGWTQIYNAAGSQCSFAQYWKVCGASEPTNYSWVWGSSGNHYGDIMSFSGNFGSNPIDATATVRSASLTNFHPNSATPTNSPSTIISAFAHDQADLHTPALRPLGYEVVTLAENTGLTFGSAYKYYSGTSTSVGPYWELAGPDSTVVGQIIIYNDGTGGGPTTYDDACTIAHAQTLTSSALFTADVSDLIAHSQTLATSAAIESDQAISLAHNHTLASESEITVETAATIAANMILNSASELDAAAAISMPITVTSATSTTAIFESALTFSLDNTLATDGIVAGSVIEDAATIALNTAIATQSDISIEGAINLAMNQTIAAQVLVEFNGNITFPSVYQLLNDSIAEFNRQAQFTQVIDFEIVGGAVLDDSATITIITGLSADGSVVQEGAITTPDSRTLKVKFDDRTLKIHFDDRTLKVH